MVKCTTGSNPDSLVSLISYSRRKKRKLRSPIHDILNSSAKLDNWFSGHQANVDLISKLCETDYCDTFNENTSNKAKRNVQFDLSRIQEHEIPCLHDVSDEYWLSDAEYAEIRESIHNTLRIHRNNMNFRNDIRHDNVSDANDLCLRGIEHLVIVPFAKSWNRRRLLYRQMTIIQYRMNKILADTEILSRSDRTDLTSRNETSMLEPLSGLSTRYPPAQMNISSCDAERARQFGLQDETDARLIHNTAVL